MPSVASPFRILPVALSGFLALVTISNPQAAEPPPLPEIIAQQAADHGIPMADFDPALLAATLAATAANMPSGLASALPTPEDVSAALSRLQDMAGSGPGFNRAGPMTFAALAKAFPEMVANATAGTPDQSAFRAAAIASGIVPDALAAPSFATALTQAMQHAPEFAATLETLALAITQQDLSGPEAIAALRDAMAEEAAPPVATKRILAATLALGQSASSPELAALLPQQVWMRDSGNGLTLDVTGDGLVGFAIPSDWTGDIPDFDGAMPGFMMPNQIAAIMHTILGAAPTQEIAAYREGDTVVLRKPKPLTPVPPKAGSRPASRSLDFTQFSNSGNAERW